MKSTDIRLMVQDEGVETVEKVINKQSDKFLRDILKRVVSKIWYRSFTYFSWNKATEDEIKLIGEIFTELEKEDYSYSVYIQSPFLEKNLNIQCASRNRDYVFVPNAEGAAILGHSGRLLANYLRHADERNFEEKEYE